MVKASRAYNAFLTHRRKAARPLIFIVLLFCLFAGGNYRAIEIKNHSAIHNGFENYVDAASHFRTHPGGCNFDSVMQMKEHPDEYVFTRHPQEPAIGCFESEKGWAFFLDLIFAEGQKSIRGLADTVLRWNLMLDLGALVCLFFAGRALAGPLGGCTSALLYALFKPAMSHMSLVSYYYWPYPFMALSLAFWTAIYRPEKKPGSLPRTALWFFLYGLAMGFAVFGRLVFLFLPAAMSPVVLFRERNFQRAVILLTALAVGEGIMLAPQVLITHKWYGRYTLSTRAKWTNAICGLGAYVNPWGIQDTNEMSANQWAVKSGGPDLRKVGTVPWDRFFKQKALQFLKERPDIFWRNARRNLYNGITGENIGGLRYSGSSAPLFYGIGQKYFSRHQQFLRALPWSIPLLAIVILLFDRQRFGPLLSTIFLGLYPVGIICLFFPPVDTHIAGYYPAYVLLIGTLLAVAARAVLAFPEGAWRGLSAGLPLTEWPGAIGACFREDWDGKPVPAPEADAQKPDPLVKWVLAAAAVSCVTLFLQDRFMEKVWNDAIDRKPDAAEVRLINHTILNPETSGGFETWDEKEGFAPGQGPGNWDGWVFGKSGPDGAVKQTTDRDNVRIGKAAAEIKLGGSAGATLTFSLMPDKVYRLLGKKITLEAWVKSDNKTPGAISLAMLGNINPDSGSTAFYQNSGGWEKISATFTVAKDNISYMLVRFAVASPHTVTYLDGAGIKSAP